MHTVRVVMCLGAAVVGTVMLTSASAFSEADGVDQPVQPIGGPMNRQKATFAAGCFWGVEAAFRQVSGVIETAVGYTGGQTKHPAYEQVCRHTTGHAEAVEIDYDPAQVSYEKLLEVFWNIHNPTTLNRQGPDWGSQYRSAIFFHTPEQRAQAEASKAQRESTHRYDRPIVTEIVPAAEFYRAEEYHQRYVEKHGGGQCPINLGRKPSSP